MKFSVLTACKFSNSHVKQGHIDSNYPTKNVEENFITNIYENEDVTCNINRRVM